MDRPEWGFLSSHRHKLPGPLGIVKMIENAVCCDTAGGYAQTEDVLQRAGFWCHLPLTKRAEHGTPVRISGITKQK